VVHLLHLLVEVQHQFLVHHLILGDLLICEEDEREMFLFISSSVVFKGVQRVIIFSITTLFVIFLIIPTHLSFSIV